jgi:hypothetical protein
MSTQPSDPEPEFAPSPRALAAAFVVLAILVVALFAFLPPLLGDSIVNVTIRN